MSLINPRTTWTLSEVRRRCLALGINCPENASKAQLIDLINSTLSNSNNLQLPSTPPDNSWTIDQLRRECVRRGIQCKSGLRKADLIRLLNPSVEPQVSYRSTTPNMGWTARDLYAECLRRGIQCPKSARKSRYLELLSQSSQTGTNASQGFRLGSTSLQDDQRETGSTRLAFPFPIMGASPVRIEIIRDTEIRPPRSPVRTEGLRSGEIVRDTEFRVIRMIPSRATDEPTMFLVDNVQTGQRYTRVIPDTSPELSVENDRNSAEWYDPTAQQRSTNVQQLKNNIKSNKRVIKLPGTDREITLN